MKTVSLSGVSCFLLWLFISFYAITLFMSLKWIVKEKQLGTVSAFQEFIIIRVIISGIQPLNATSAAI